MLDFEKTYDFLYKSKKDIPKKYYKFYDILIIKLDVQEMKKYIKIRHHRFILSQDFLIFFSTDSSLIKLKNNSNQIYNFFEHLKNYNFIHEDSDCFPIKQPMSKINKYHNFLAKNHFYLIDEITEFINYIHKELSIINLELSIFISLVYFEEHNWNEFAIENSFKNDLFWNETIGYQSIISDALQDGFKNIKIYKIKITSFLLLKNKKEKLFSTKYTDLFESARKIIHLFFKKDISLNNIRKALIFNNIMDENPLITACKYKKTSTIPISLSELSYLGIGVPTHLSIIEINNLKIIQKKVKNKWIKEMDDYSDETYLETEFDYNFKIAPLFFFIENKRRVHFLKKKQRDLKLNQIQTVKNNMLKKVADEKDKTTILVIRYIISLLNRIYVGKKIADKIGIQTFTQYINILKNHLFLHFSDYESIDENKFYFILGTLKNGGISKNTFLKLKYLIVNFFNFHNKIFSKYEFHLKYMFKSIVFEKEIDLILLKIEETIKQIAKQNSHRYSKIYKEIVEEYQAFIILGFYSGLRLNEIRTRMHSDLYNEPHYIYNSSIKKNVFSIDINLKGLKLDKNAHKINSFKSSNAKRRVIFHIRNNNHAIIFQNFIENSYIKNKKYLFKDFDVKNKKRFTTVLKLSKLNFLNNIILQVTNRYSTLHSMRHSYVTYWLLYRIKENKTFNDALLNLSLEVGHVTPTITMQNYMHYSLIEEIIRNEK